MGNLEEAPESKKDSEDDDGDTNRVLPPVTDGQPAVANQVDVLSKTTRPPPHFTEGTLLKAMMSAGAKNDAAEIRDLLSNGGIGTQATRQEILEKLKKSEYAVLQGNKYLRTKE